jgi:tetratricopeptide (TPR) repeat protein
MKWAANLQKNLGRYDEAAVMAGKAYRIYDEQGDRRRAGEAATELSHVLYEAFSFEKAHEWGETALDHYAAVGHPSLVARARIDLARMLAMLRPDEGAEAEFEWSVRLALHAGIGSNVAKALMNWGIFMAVERLDAEGAARRFHDAAESLRLHPNAYLATLLEFVRLSLSGGAGAAESLRDSPIGARLVEWCRHYEDPAQIGDRRMQQLLKSLAAAGHAQVAEWLHKFPGNVFEPYVGIGLGRAFEKRERGNPLLGKGGQRLYY